VSFVVVVLAAILLAATLWWLQRQQVRGRAETVERSRELPPLSKEQLPDFRPGAQAAGYSSSPPGTGPTGTGVATASSVDLSASTTSTATPRATTTSAQQALVSPWQDQVKQLKDSSDLDTALALCQQQFPKSQAFQQAAIVLRLQMKHRLEHRADIGPLLAKLYRCAVLADLFRNGVTPKPSNPRAALKQLAGHEFDYRQVGHQQLKLLNKSDILLLEQRWGKPYGHSHAEAVLGTEWENICR
jgi:hypothetical protein